MNKVWTESHWRGFAVALVAIGVVAAARAGGEDTHCTPSLVQAQTSLRDVPAAMGPISGVDVARASDLATAQVDFAKSGDFAKPLAACAAQSPKIWNREAQSALASTITMTTTNVIDRNPAHAITLAFARP